MAHSNNGVDLVAYDSADRVILLAEVKGRLGTSEQWAANFRRNMLAHGFLPNSHFFMIATPERMYFWKQDQQGGIDSLPSFTLDAPKALKPYLERLGKSPQALGEHSLGLLVSSWLSEMTLARGAPEGDDPSTRWLAESGLLDSLGAGRIELHPA